MIEYIYTLLPAMIDGLVTTLEVFSIVLILSIPLGILVSIGRLSNIKPISKITELYMGNARDPLNAADSICFFRFTHSRNNF